MEFNENKPDIIKYLPTNMDENIWEMSVNSIGRQCAEPKNILISNENTSKHTKPGTILNDFSLIYICKGEGVFSSINCPETKVHSGDAFFVFPDQWHNYHPNPNTKWNIYWVTFHGKYFEKLLTHIINKEDPIYHVGVKEVIVKNFSQMLDFAITQPNGYEAILSSLTLYLISLILSISKNQIQNNEFLNMQKIQEACIFMQENIYDKFTLEDIAQSTNMSYSNFRKVFKQHTGITPHQYILQIKLSKVKELLSNTSMSVHDIAAKLNFESSDYFSYFFRNKIGISPLSYRKKTQKNIK